MFCFQAGGAGAAPAAAGNHWSKPVRTMRAWNSSVNGAASFSSACRSGESSQACRLRLGVEAQDGKPVVLHAGDRRLEPIALEARRLRLGGGDALLPRAVARPPGLA